MRSSGSASRIARTTVSPPSPESKMPRGGSETTRRLRFLDAQDAGATGNEWLAANGRERAQDRALFAGVRDDAHGDGFTVARRPTLLHHLLDADAVAAESRCNATDDPGMIADVETKVVASLDLVLREERPIGERDAARLGARFPTAPGTRDVDEIGDDAHGRRHVAGAATDEQTRAKRASHDEHAVQDPVDVGEDARLSNERRVNTELDALAAIVADTKVLERETEAI